MITYTVYYKKRFFWKKIKKVKGDGFVENGLSRFFITENEIRIEIPQNNIEFKFSKERYYSIKEAMAKESGQDIKTQ
jgi:hypothetical protein